MQAEALRAVRAGWVDPSDCSRDPGALFHVAETAAPGFDVDPDTVALARAAMAGWSTDRHHLYHAAVKTSVHAVLLTAWRLRNPSGSGSGQVVVPGSVKMLPLRPLPTELWWLVLRFIHRRYWRVASGRA
jgi:hypothetical protein